MNRSPSRLRAVSAACLLLPLLAEGQALPSGLQVVRGSAGVSTQGGSMTVTNSANAILNWQSFSIGSGHGVHFQQPGVSSQVLNRVVGNDPSSILGSLTSNGRVWLLNPNGVIFGRNARVDVAGLVASTLGMADSDWLAGRYRLDAGNTLAGAGVQNLGDIRTAAGGRVLLAAAGEVRNEGRIDAPSGQVALVSARQVELVDSARPNLSVQVSAPAGEVLNLGQLQAAGGRVDLQGAMVNQQGLVNADAIGRGPAGEVLLQASGDTLVSGTVSARSEAGTGGDIRLLGRHVGLVGSARVDASGAAGGGQVLVGGGQQGRDASVPNAEASFIGPDASIAADATQAGDGGRIVVWSDHATRVYGTLLARGGPAGGDGGFIETSGGWLVAAPRQVSAAAPAGRPGQWLLDPNDIFIGDQVVDTNVTGNPDFTTTSDAAGISSASIVNALNNGNDVTITTGNAAPNTGFGDIVVDTATLLSFSNTTPVTLTFNAARDLVFRNSTVGAQFGTTLGVALNAGTAGGGGTVTMSQSSIGTAGADLSIAAPALAMDASTLDASSGRIVIQANSVRLINDSTIASLATGDAIVVQGFGQRFVTTFVSEPGSSLVVDGGRWLVLAENLAAFDPGTLNYGFVQYGDTPPQDLVNSGVIFNLTPTVSLGGSATKVYDGGTFIALDTAGLAVTGGAINGDAVSLSSATPTSLFGDFADPNAGAGKPITVNPGALVATDTAGRTVFGYAATTAGSITPRPLALTAVTAADKLYDGSAATAASAVVSGLVGSQTLGVSASGTFSSPDVGTAKPVLVSATLSDGANGGLAANYTVSPALASASITPATLSYVATPALAVFGTPLPTLTGSVNGFVGGETLTTATTGLLSFTTGATSSSLPGLYAVQGGGLAATNYVFVQDPANAQALRMLPPQAGTPPETTVALTNATDHATPPPVPPTVVGTAPVLDATQATRPQPGGGVSFQPLPLADMSGSQVSRTLQARDDYKRQVFAAALRLLDKDPGLADLPACQSVEQLQTGRCLVTESLKAQVQAASPPVVAAAPQPQPQAAPPPPAGATAAAPAPAPAPARPAAAPSPAPQALALLPAARTVRAATLPQIQRKVALVVGVDRYADRRIPQLENAVSDARAVARTLEDQLGYETVVLEDAGKEALVAALNRLALQARPHDSVVIYYAGHGELAPSTGLGYWQLANANADDPRGWVSNTDIGKLMGLIGASQVALVSDSCYSGSLVGGERIRPQAAGDAAPLLQRKAAVAMSSGGNEPVADEGRDGHSPFAWNLMQQLGALPAWQPGGNVFERVRFAVSRQLPQRPQYGAAPQGGHQSGADYLFERRQLER